MSKVTELIEKIEKARADRTGFPTQHAVLYDEREILRLTEALKVMREGLESISRRCLDPRKANGSCYMESEATLAQAEKICGESAKGEK